MRKGKRLGLLAMMMAAAMTAGAQENAGAGSDVETTVAADAVSQYIWRGQDLGGISVQPTLGVSYKGFSATLWGSVGLESKDTKEFDITLAYSIGGFNIGVTDYWFNQNGQDTANRYFMYESHKTNHVFEANVGYDFSVAAIQWYTNLAGNDGVKLFYLRFHIFSAYSRIALSAAKTPLRAVFIMESLPRSCGSRMLSYRRRCVSA